MYILYRYINYACIKMQVAELVKKRGFFEAVILVRLLLKILSTRLGTLLICGIYCFGEKWPYINKFKDMSVENREKVIQKWYKHRFLTPIRLGFVLLKLICFYVFFSLVNHFFFFSLISPVFPVLISYLFQFFLFF